MKIFLILFILLSNCSVWADQFEKDLAALKSKYKDVYKKDESTKWSEVTEDDLEGDFSVKVEKTINRADLLLNLEYFFFKDQLADFGKINGDMSQVGIDLEMIFNTGSLLDVLFYTSYGFTSNVTFTFSENVYDSPNTFNIGLGGYWTRGFSKINPYVTLEYEALSSMGVNKILLPTLGLETALRGNSIHSVHLVLGIEHPFYLTTRPTYLRAYFGTALYGASRLQNSVQKEKVNIFKMGANFKMNAYANILFVLGWKSEIVTGVTSSYLSHFNLNIGYSF